jgi:hypothetical protein
MPMSMAIAFPGNYCVGEGNTTLYDYRLDGPAIREPSIEIDDYTLIP